MRGLVQRCVSPGKQAGTTHAGSIPCVPELGRHMRPARRSYSCLLSGQGGLALAEVHLFMLLTNFQRNFIGWGEWRVE